MEKLFERLEEGEGEQFHKKKYAYNVGFSVCCSSETKDKKGLKHWKYFVCSKECYKSNTTKVVEQSE